MTRLGTESTRAKAVVANAAIQPIRAKLVKSGAAGYVEVDEGFERAWRRVGLALDRVGFTVEDRDRQNGLYYVRYADADAEREKPGLLSRLFSDKEELKPAQYRVQVKAEREASQVNVLNKEGGAEKSATGQRILTLLHEQLK